MNDASTGRSASRASSVSSGSSTPITRRRKPSRTSASMLRNSSASSTTSSPRTLRGLQTKLRTVKWTDSNRDNGNAKDADTNNEFSNQQLQRQAMQNDQASTTSSQRDNTTPSTVIVCLSSSNPTSNNNNNNNTNDNIMLDANSPVVSDDEVTMNDVVISAEVPVLDSQIKQNLTKHAELLAFSDICENGNVYRCKLCQAVRSFPVIVWKQRKLTVLYCLHAIETWNQKKLHSRFIIDFEETRSINRKSSTPS